MKKTLKLTVVLGLIFALGACSLTKTNENGDNPDAQAPPTADAATDAVPQPAAELAATPPPPAADAAQAVTPPPADAAAAPVAPPVEAPKVEQQAQVDQTPAPVQAASASGSSDSYTVQQGDTLMKIAFETYGDLYRWRGIYEANKDKISDPNHVPPGVVLQLEKPASPVEIDRNGEKYLIKSGDTLGTISNDVYGTKSKWKVLWENNKQLIHDPNKIFAGFYLYYQPDGSSPSAPSNVTPQPMAEAPAPVATTTATTPPAPAPAAVEAPRAPASVPAVPAPSPSAAP